MEPFQELEKYKAFLDEGVISEDEFRKIKQKLLGLKTDEEKELEKQQARTEALTEIERMKNLENSKEQHRFQEANTLSKEQDRLERERQKHYVETFSEEKAREKARLEALQEVQQRQKSEQRETITKSVTSILTVVVTILLWIVTAFCLLESVACFGGMATGTVAFGILNGVFMLIFAILACPLITQKTRDIPQLIMYYRYKKGIVFALVILYLILIVRVG